jgi:hypothetical protein
MRKLTRTDKLYEAVAAYIKELGGSAVVIGGTALVEEGNGKYKYGLMIRIVGKKPQLPIPK